MYIREACLGCCEAIIRSAASTRDQLMILIAYRHGLRVSELRALMTENDPDAIRAGLAAIANAPGRGARGRRLTA